jgi:hypothetical protein
MSRHTDQPPWQVYGEHLQVLDAGEAGKQAQVSAYARIALHGFRQTYCRPDHELELFAKRAFVTLGQEALGSGKRRHEMIS